MVRGRPVNTASWAWQQLSVGKKATVDCASADCHAEVYVENLSLQPVWFDGLEIAAGGAPVAVVVQEAHYDPWGLELAGIGYNASGNPEHKFTYNGKEKQDQFGLGWLDCASADYHARQVGPALGRMWAVDPLAGKFAPVNPWAYALNNPLRVVDPTGMEVEETVNGIRYTSEDARRVIENLKAKEKRDKIESTYQHTVTLQYKYDSDGSHILTKINEFKKWTHTKGKVAIETITSYQQMITIINKDGTIKVLGNEMIRTTKDEISSDDGGKSYTYKLLSDEATITKKDPLSMDKELMGYQETLNAQLAIDKTWNAFKPSVEFKGKGELEIGSWGLGLYDVFTPALNKLAEVASKNFRFLPSIGFPSTNPWVAATAIGLATGSQTADIYHKYADHRGRSMTIYSTVVAKFAK
jgi:RHS repeat-associated protein